ncbi:hypothetical protein FH972_023073 [Carpinus fangiana]|uniref:Uncharacterized protein n=1 Tax=Carpinus fangiana TaxID=176857 RepID=A0A5N6KUH3_9ROSI|nr:hypothetical protein FH972_023073 [Carpinus fangiana]
MPDIDINPSALARQDSIANGSTTPVTASKMLSLNTSAQKGAKMAQSVPRAELFPLYTLLKTSIGDDYWLTYKEAVSKFILGALSQDELARQIDPFISSNEQTTNCHNQLICALQSNVLRDPPETSVATWVSANDKPTSVSKPASGDAAEHRLRTEVMQLPPRTRHRLKNVQDESPIPITTSIIAIANAKRPATSTTQASILPTNPATLTPASAAPSLPTPGPSSASGLTKDAEIRRRYAQPLAQEAHDIPALNALTDRILPICYEEGLQSGANAPAACAEFLSMALETMLKGEIGTFLGRVRANAPVSRPPLAPAETTAPAPGLSAPTLAAPSMERTASGAPPSSAPMERTASHRSIEAPSQPPLLSSADEPGLPAPATATATGISTTGLGTTQTSSITTSAFKRQLAHEEALFAQGLVKRTDMGLLPCEVASLAAQGGGRGLPGDLRLAWQLGGEGGQTWWGGLTPWLGQRVASDADGGEEWSYVQDAQGLERPLQLPPSPPDSRDGKAKVGGGGVGTGEVDMPDAVGDVDALGDADSDVDMSDVGDGDGLDGNWVGSGREDHDALASLLDECLAG